MKFLLMCLLDSLPLIPVTSYPKQEKPAFSRLAFQQSLYPVEIKSLIKKQAKAFSEKRPLASYWQKAYIAHVLSELKKDKLVFDILVDDALITPYFYKAFSTELDGAIEADWRTIAQKIIERKQLVLDQEQREWNETWQVTEK